MNVLDLFSAAAGGWSLGLHRAGFTTIAACEVVDWRRALYAENNPGVHGLPAFGVDTQAGGFDSRYGVSG